MDVLDLRLGRAAVKLARKAIEAEIADGSVSDLTLEDRLPSEKRGVFVSLYTHPHGELRGCIGYPFPTTLLAEAVAKAAVAAATQDPRFEPLMREELGHVVVEVSILTTPEEVRFESRTQLPNLIRVGYDGLIIETPYGDGLLLPQVPVEYGWDAETYLTHLCLKAGLDPTYWLYGKMRLLRYTAQIFREREPGGEVVEVRLGV